MSNDQSTDSYQYSGDTSRFAMIMGIGKEVKNLTQSPLYKYRVETGGQPVVSSGSVDASIMFIGEAPGQEEAKQGRPFAGASGDVLDSCLDKISLRREDVFITNIVLDRPPRNRDSKEDEISTYSQFLDRQIKIVEPETLVTLGRFSASYMIQKLKIQTEEKTISRIAGKVWEVKVSWGTMKFVPMFHPAVVLYTPSKKDVLYKHFEVLRGNLKP